MALCAAVRDAWSGEAIIESSPVMESRSNGQVERAVQEVQGLTRTYREDFETRTGMHLDSASPLLAWMVEWAGAAYSIYSRGRAGLTPSHRLRGRPWRIQLPAFGEVVEFAPRGLDKLAVKWRSGVFVGVCFDITENVIATEAGAVKVQSIRRRPEGSRVDLELLKSVRAVPWNMGSGQADPVHMPLQIAADPLNPDVPRSDPAAAEERVRVSTRYYILRGDLERYGRTDCCPACVADAMGESRKGTSHSDMCRARVEAAIVAEGGAARARLEAQVKRNQDRAAQAGTVNVSAAPGRPPPPVRPPPPKPAASSHGSPGFEVRVAGHQGGDGSPRKRARGGGATAPTPPMAAPPGLVVQGGASSSTGPAPHAASAGQKRAAEDEPDDDNRCLETDAGRGPRRRSGRRRDADGPRAGARPRPGGVASCGASSWFRGACSR